MAAANEGINGRTVKDEQQKRIAKKIAGRISSLVLGTAGVDRLSGWSLTGSGRKKGPRQPVNGVRIIVKDDKVRADVHIVVSFGKSIPEIARRIQKDAKELIELEFPELSLAAVNVQVDGVRFDPDSAEYRKRSVGTLEELRGLPEEY